MLRTVPLYFANAPGVPGVAPATGKGKNTVPEQPLASLNLVDTNTVSIAPAKEKTVKYIFVTGGVVSSIGKGITSAALGRLLRNRGFEVAMQKLDPYINVDAGTMNPYQHGECFRDRRRRGNRP